MMVVAIQSDTVSFANQITASEAKYAQEASAHPSETDSPCHLFVDNVRFWSMFAIVVIHSTGVFGLFGEVSPRWTETVVAPWKFGTISFFLISGFLLGERLQSCRPIDYVSRRLRKVFLPWLFWISLLTVALVASDVMHHRVALPFGFEVFPIVGRKFLFCLTSTAFWFVPNLFVALCVLLLFRRYLYEVRLGAALLAINLFYVVNIYMLWIPSTHLKAIFGFVFHLWLGSYASRHYSSLTQWISRIKMAVLAGLALLTGLIGFGEALILDHLNSTDPNNTLRLSNQIFSIAVVLLILKIRRATWPSFVDVRRHTFGIYLSHSIILVIVFAMIRRSCTGNVASTFMKNDVGSLGLWLIASAAVYSLSLAIARAIARQRHFQWMIGADSLQAQPRRFSHQVPVYETQPVSRATGISFN